MSSFTNERVQPTLKTVRTDGPLKGDVIADAAQSAKEIVAQIVHNPTAMSSQSLAAEVILRGLARVDKGKGISKLARVEKGLAKAGLDLFAVANV